MSFPIYQSIDEFVVQIKGQPENQRENYIRRHSQHYIAQHNANANFQVDLCRILFDVNYRYLWSNQNQTTTTNEDPIVQDINNEHTSEPVQQELTQQELTLEGLTRENEELTRENEELFQENQDLTYEYEELTNEYEELTQELRILQQRISVFENNERQRRESSYRRECFFNRPKFGTKCINKNDSKTNEVCPICLDNNILTKNMLWFNCNHGVCSSCITELLKPKPSPHICPLCRKKIDVVCLKYNRSESTKNQIWQSENVKKILNSICM
jgi:hypothetical protein